MVYYNEIDPFAAAWLRELMAVGMIPDGVVDERSIEDVLPAELAPYRQCHFFAGIGGWAYALRLAGWPDERPVWTASCPCQPFSAAGKGGGFADERHLWPACFWLIRQCRPGTVFGEQVASKAGLAWLDLVQSDMEGEGYSIGAVDFCAASVGAPHIRQRLYWCADTKQLRRDGLRGSELAGATEEGRLREPERSSNPVLRSGDAASHRHEAVQRGEYGDVCSDGASVGTQSGPQRPQPDVPIGLIAGFWQDAEWLPCRDGKYRPVEPGVFPLAHGVPARVGRLRGYGNAIVAPQAEAFVRAYMDV